MSDGPGASGVSGSEAVITVIEVDGVRVLKVSGHVGHGDVPDVRAGVRRRPFEQPLVVDLSDASVLEPLVADEIARDLYWRSQSAKVGLVATGPTRRRFDDTLIAATVAISGELGALLDSIGGRVRRATIHAVVGTGEVRHGEGRAQEAVEDVAAWAGPLREIATDVRRSRVLIVVDERRREWVDGDGTSVVLRRVAGLAGVEVAVVSRRSLVDLVGRTRLSGVIHLLGAEEWENVEQRTDDARVAVRIARLRSQLGADASITLEVGGASDARAGAGAGPDGVVVVVERSSESAGRAGAGVRMSIESDVGQVLDLLTELRLAG